MGVVGCARWVLIVVYLWLGWDSVRFVILGSAIGCCVELLPEAFVFVCVGII